MKREKKNPLMSHRLQETQGRKFGGGKKATFLSSRRFASCFASALSEMKADVNAFKSSTYSSRRFFISCYFILRVAGFPARLITFALAPQRRFCEAENETGKEVWNEQCSKLFLSFVVFVFVR